MLIVNNSLTYISHIDSYHIRKEIKNTSILEIQTMSCLKTLIKVENKLLALLAENSIQLYSSITCNVIAYRYFDSFDNEM